MTTSRVLFHKYTSSCRPGRKVARRQFIGGPAARSLSGSPTNYQGPITIGIRREDPRRIWERRSPLTPADVHGLIRKSPVDVRVLIQPCARRVFPLEDFLEAGAHAHPTLAPAHIILGIKEPPLSDLLTDPLPPPSKYVVDPPVERTHFMFSHSAKGQVYNMPLLARFLHNPLGSSESHSGTIQPPSPLPTLIDYELLTDDHGRRTAGFGWHAGVAGALEGLISTAHLYLELGIATPFLHTPRPHTAPLATLRVALRGIGSTITASGTPRCSGPFIVCVTGTGQVARGALSLLSELPIEHITVSDLPRLVTDPDTPLNRIYLLHATPETYLSRTDGGAYTRANYYANPAAYESHFHKRIAPYLTVLMNGVGWAPGSPRLMTSAQLSAALAHVQVLHRELNPAGTGGDAFSCISGTREDGVVEVMKGRCRSFADVSCDVQGGLEFLPRSSTLSAPFFTHRPPNHPKELPPVQLMAVDILPTALPLDASVSFSAGIMKYLEAAILRYAGTDMRDDEAAGALARATIAASGELVRKHRWLQQPIEQWRASAGPLPPQTTVSPRAHTTGLSRLSPQKNILLLGSGMVAGPAVSELCKRNDARLIIASNDMFDGHPLTLGQPNARGYTVDMSDTEAVGRLISESDIVISLLPVSFHVPVAELCIKHRRNLVTASYISPGMQALHDRALSADVLLLNEIGLDPGIDHCSAVSLLSSLRHQNKEIISFTSFCGGLPAPEHADVPLRYKFSWSPQGVLKAALNAARFRLDGQEWEIPGEHILRANFGDIPISSVLKLEGVANRDSIPYASTYGLQSPESLRTVLRGTLRYPGFCELMDSFKRIGLLGTQTQIKLDSWASLAYRSLGLLLAVPIKDESSFHSALMSVIPRASLSQLLEALTWLGLTPSADSDTSLPEPPSSAMQPLNLFAVLLSYKLRYQPHERDLVILHHEVTTKSTDARSASEEVHVSSLEVYGTAEASAMSRCVGLPVTFAALKVLDGEVHSKGVRGPTDVVLYSHILERLAEAGLPMKNYVHKGEKGRGIEENIRDNWISGH